MQQYVAYKHPGPKSYNVLSVWLIIISLVGGLYIGYIAHGSSPSIGVHMALDSVTPPQLAPTLAPFTFPNGGRMLANSYRIVALYGTPDEPALGALGQQSLPDSITRVKELAAQYAPLSPAPILPAFEIIATVASATPTTNDDYSSEIDVSALQPWVTAAQAAGVYVVLDLQPGRSDFLTQAKEYQSLLEQPNVGLALDPEWRLAPGQLPLVQIGSVGIDEVNSVISWLATLTKANHLPQKLFLLHQFRLSMLPDREQLDTSKPQLAYIIQMDGQGAQLDKQTTWQAVTASPPSEVNFGWKNFYLKDSPMLDPASTLRVSPEPWYISYQ